MTPPDFEHEVTSRNNARLYTLITGLVVLSVDIGFSVAYHAAYVLAIPLHLLALSGFYRAEKAYQIIIRSDKIIRKSPFGDLEIAYDSVIDMSSSTIYHGGVPQLQIQLLTPQHYLSFFTGIFHHPGRDSYDACRQFNDALLAFLQQKGVQPLAESPYRLRRQARELCYTLGQLMWYVSLLLGPLLVSELLRPLF